MGMGPQVLLLPGLPVSTFQFAAPERCRWLAADQRECRFTDVSGLAADGMSISRSESRCHVLLSWSGAFTVGLLLQHQFNKQTLDADRGERGSHGALVAGLAGRSLQPLDGWRVCAFFNLQCSFVCGQASPEPRALRPRGLARELVSLGGLAFLGGSRCLGSNLQEEVLRQPSAFPAQRSLLS